MEASTFQIIFKSEHDIVDHLLLEIGINQLVFIRYCS